LPDDGVVNRLARGLVPNKRRFALVGDADGRNVFGADAGAFDLSPLAENRPDLAGVDVVARIVPRQDYDLPLGDVKAFWRTYFEQTGASYGSVN